MSPAGSAQSIFLAWTRARTPALRRVRNEKWRTVDVFGAYQRLTRRTLLRVSGLAGGSAVAFSFGSRSLSASNNAFPNAITSVMQKPRYARSTWSLFVADVAAGGLYELRPDQIALTARSAAFLGRSCSGAARRGSPLHDSGVPNGARSTRRRAAGDLVLVAASDLTLGGRLNTVGTIAYTDFDHNDANNLDTTILVPRTPCTASTIWPSKCGRRASGP